MKIEQKSSSLEPLRLSDGEIVCKVDSFSNGSEVIPCVSIDDANSMLGNGSLHLTMDEAKALYLWLKSVVDLP